MIQTWLDERGLKLGELDPKGADFESLIGFLHAQAKQAGEEIDLHVPEIQKMKASELTEDYLKTPEGQQEMQQEMAKQQEKFANHPGGAEKAKVVAQAEVLKRRAKAVEKAAEEKTVTGPENVAAHQPSSMPGVEPLPPALRGSKPRYSYGTGNNFELQFEDPRDLAAYVLSTTSRVTKSAAHDQFGEYYKKQFGDLVGVESHARRVRDAIKEQAKNWDGEGKKVLQVKSTSPKIEPPKATPETARQRTDSRYEYDNKGNVTAYSMSISFDWIAARENAASKLGGSDTTKFWNEYVDTLAKDNDDDTSVAHALAQDLRQYFDPLKEAELSFEKSNTDGGDWTNFLAYMYQHRETLPKPVARKLEEVLLNSPKMSALIGRKTTLAGIEEFSQAIQNHIDIFMRSKWYQEYGERHIFRSTQPGISAQSKWQKDLKLIRSSHKLDMAKGNSMFVGRSKAVLEAKHRFQTTMKAFQDAELVAYKKGSAKTVAKIMAKARAVLAETGVK
jgi:hypothetical protein